MAAFSQNEIDAFGARAEAMVNALGAISAEPDRLVRLFLTSEHRRAADRIGGWMREAGLEVSEDALGTVRGRLDGRQRLLIGSHIDTVIDAGKYDGNFGVIAGILAAEHFARRANRLTFGIDVLAFGDEEGSRFPATLSSSSACAGLFRAENLQLADRNGVALVEAIKAYGKSPDDIPHAAYKAGEAAAYVEVHIEQGPVLESRNQPLAVVTAIIGQTYLNIEFLGEAAHAGTVPMMLRRDALAGAAEAMLLGERLARETKGEVVATVGRMTVAPGASNVIPGKVVVVFDIRSGSEPARAKLADALKAGAREISDRRQLSVTITSTREVATTPCHPAIQDQFAEAIRAIGAEPLRLGSGAGHDGQAMAKLCPIGMLFVRCRGGISHNPKEYASPRDLGLAVAALIGFIERFEPEKLLV
ncbi:MAG TPA: allantoate amidohydrolase [Xanthobacteraceae bacterium]|nr:allantoate amidohydrolase [Xanthobacteraceae bacterium]